MNWLIWVVVGLAAVFFALKIADFFVKKHREKNASKKPAPHGVDCPDGDDHKCI